MMVKTGEDDGEDDKDDWLRRIFTVNYDQSEGSETLMVMMIRSK